MIESARLTKRLGGRVVVSDASFQCEPGTVTGFLGPNGAGKTTTMRMLSASPSRTRATLACSAAATATCPIPGGRVGILLDASAQHAGRRGREALIVSAQVMGVRDERVDGCFGSSASTRPRPGGGSQVLAGHAPAPRSRRTRCSAIRRS